MAVHWDVDGKIFSAQFLPNELFDFTDELEVTFTENTGDYVKGNFTGHVFTPLPTREEIVITDGEFKFSKN